MTWVVVSNTNECWVYKYSRSPEDFRLVHHLARPENKLKDKDLASDKPGHYKTATATRGDYEQETSPREALRNDFAREIAELLDKARVEHHYDELIFIVVPKMYGAILDHTNKFVDTLIRNRLEKDLTHLKKEALLEYLKKHMHYPD